MREKKKLKRRESKLKLKGKRQAEKHNKNKPKLAEAKNVAVNGVIVKDAGKAKSVVTKEGKLVFSKFDFSETGKQSSASDLTGKDYKRILEKLDKRKEKLNKLREKDKDLAEAFEEKTAWKTALLKADGEKVKDDPKLLKKSMKRKEKIKGQKKKKWSERDDQVKKRKDARLDKREKNIQSRIDAKKDKKTKKSKNKGRNMPGF